MYDPHLEQNPGNESPQGSMAQSLLFHVVLFLYSFVEAVGF
jgi:hypothetical protein